MAREKLDREGQKDALHLKAAAMISAEKSKEGDVKEEWHLVDNTRSRPLPIDRDEPLVDTTEKIALRSKRTERLQKKLQKKDQKRLRSDIHSFLDLPSELLTEVLTYLRPSDIFALKRVSRAARDYIEDQERVISVEIIDLRYPILAECFPLPVLLDDVDKSFHPALLSPTHQERLNMHRTPYFHIQSSDPDITCSCMACVLAWNNLCLIVDLAHWQNKLDHRDHLPVLGRIIRPDWNISLMRSHANIVLKAIHSPLWRAAVLQRHLDTTVRTIIRKAVIRREHAIYLIKLPPNTKRLLPYSETELASETDAFLQQKGPPSFEFPFSRDSYYALGTHVPNRRWDSVEGNGRWLYYGSLHENDVGWAVRTYEREQVAEKQIEAAQDQKENGRWTREAAAAR